MEKILQCPKCGSTEIEVRDHNKLLKTQAGSISGGGNYSWNSGGAATGASVGATRLVL
jgi:hypothetical protein